MSYLIQNSFYRMLFCRHLKGKPSLCTLNIFGNTNGNMYPDDHMKYLKNALPGVTINSEMMSSIARPTVGIRRTSIWGIRCRDWHRRGYIFDKLISLRFSIIFYSSSSSLHNFYKYAGQLSGNIFIDIFCEPFRFKSC